MLSKKLAAASIDVAVYEPIFDRAVALYAKSLVIVMTIPFAALLAALLARQRRPFAEHMVFALHVYSFLLFLYCAALAISGIDLLRGGAGLASPLIDTILTLVNLGACSVYLFMAIGTVYGLKGAARAVTSLVLAGAILGIALAYRFGLLVLTLRVT